MTIKNFNNMMRILNKKIRDINTQVFILQYNPNYKLKINQKYIIDIINNDLNNIYKKKNIKNINWDYINEYYFLSENLFFNYNNNNSYIRHLDDYIKLKKKLYNLTNDFKDNNIFLL